MSVSVLTNFLDKATPEIELDHCYSSVDAAARLQVAVLGANFSFSDGG